ncbi:MAG: hypothetical protein A2284_14070 [Deltaproteobacteria bacterium RIFOXYA12_FULL_61_11]|nr:MAG: hypothetical protein A2284_14070 [Deltaproteobacteria bacterium RIFOXYA12_FULL_61_11]
MRETSEVVLRVSGLRKSYGHLRAVDDLDLEVQGGEIFGFLGPNGAGKSTSLSMMCGLLRPDAGHIELLGLPLEAGCKASVRKIGIAPQDLVFWEMLTCKEQLEFVGRVYGFSCREARARAAELLAIFGLQEKTNSLGKTLSGGMQRRLHIALGLVHRPSMLFLDEPQAGLDPQSRVLVREVLDSLRGSTTVILTTHDMEEAEKLCDRVCIIDRGKRLVLDTVEGLERRLGEGNRFELEIDAEIENSLLPHLPHRLREAPGLAVQGKSLHFTAAEGAAMLPELLAVVTARGLHVTHLRLRKTTLEDVFLHLTGRSLRE